MPDHELSPAAQHILTALTSSSIAPTEVDIDLLSALLDGTDTSAERLLDEFFAAQLVQEHRPGRYFVRRPVTQEQGRSVDDPRQLVEWMVQQAVRADRTTRPHEWRLSPAYDLHGGGGLYDSPVHAAEWADLNRAQLLTTLHVVLDQDWLDLAAVLAEALWGLLGWTGYYQAQVTATEMGIGALIRLNFEPYILGEEERRDRAHLVRMSVAHSRLSMARTDQGAHKIAVHTASTAIELGEQSGEPAALAMALGARGRAIHAAGELTGALVDLQQAVEIDEAQGDERGIAARRHLIGTALSAKGLHAEALVDLGAAGHILESLGDRAGWARVLTTMGAVHVAAHSPEEAFGPLRQALPIVAHWGSTADLADVYANLARAARDAGAPAAAREYFRSASRCYRSTRLDLQADRVDAERNATS